MRQRTLLLSFFCLSVLVGLVYTVNTRDKGKVEYPKTARSEYKGVHPNIFFDKVAFYQGVTKTSKTSFPISPHIQGGVIPHHLLPGFLLTDFFKRLSFQSPKTLIFVGPNHYEKGEHPVLASEFAWETPFGVVEPDLGILNDLVKNNVVHIDESVVSNDHAVSGMMPFVAYYLPTTRVVPILVSGHMSQEDVIRLSQKIQVYLSNDTLLVTPVDFSHYLSRTEAEQKDKITRGIMEKRDYRQLFSLNNDYLDSPQSIALLLMVMDHMKQQMQILDNTNSGFILHDDAIETTSYFSIIFKGS